MPEMAALDEAAKMIDDALAARDQRTADAVVQALADAGWLRLSPHESIVKRVIRDELGQVTAIVETVETLIVDDA